MTQQTNLLLSQYEIGDRIELHPATDAWMSGDRYGEVVAIGKFYLHVKMDRFGKIRKVVPENVSKKIATGCKVCGWPGSAGKETCAHCGQQADGK